MQLQKQTRLMLEAEAGLLKSEEAEAKAKARLSKSLEAGAEAGFQTPSYPCLVKISHLLIFL